MNWTITPALVDVTVNVLVPEAVNHGWDVCTADISKAFLRGVTYKELAEATGEPLREVNFICRSIAYQFCVKCLVMKLLIL